MKDLTARISKLEIARSRATNGGIFLVFIKNGESEESALLRTLDQWGYSGPPLNNEGRPCVVYLTIDDASVL